MSQTPAITLAGLAALVCFFIVLVLEFVIVIFVVMGVAYVINGSGDVAVGWDPVSIWHQAFMGKLFLTVVIAAVLTLPIFTSSVVFSKTYHRLHSSPTGQLD